MSTTATATTEKAPIGAAGRTPASGTGESPAQASAAPADRPAGALSRAAATFRDRMLGFLSFKAFVWLKLPLAGFAGLRATAVDAKACEVAVPFGWRSQNPFGSLYFAAHAMAAEMSTGALVLLHVADQTDGKGPGVSSLITKMTATYGKAAKGLTTYRCEGGDVVAAAVRKALDSGVPVEVEVPTRGMVGGELSAEFRFTWSLKRRQAKG